MSKSFKKIKNLRSKRRAIMAGGDIHDIFKDVRPSKRREVAKMIADRMRSRGRRNFGRRDKRK